MYIPENFKLYAFSLKLQFKTMKIMHVNSIKSQTFKTKIILNTQHMRCFQQRFFFNYCVHCFNDMLRNIHTYQVQINILYWCSGILPLRYNYTIELQEKIILLNNREFALRSTTIH